MGKKTEKIKIVLDTNVYISALGWDGLERKLINECFAGKFKLFISNNILGEISKVFSYPKFDFSEEETANFLDFIAKCAIKIQPQKILNIIKEDTADNRFLECALEAHAGFIISGDKHLLSLKEFEGIKILKTFQFFKII